MLFPITFLMDVYFPIGIVFGIPNDGQVASAFNTDPAEAIEFFKTVFGWTIVFPISAMAALLIFFPVNLNLNGVLINF